MPDEHRLDQPAGLVTSPANPTIKLARSLHRRRIRERERVLLVEGVRSLDAVLTHGASVRTILIDAARYPEIDPTLIERLPSSTRIVQVEHGLFETIALTEHPQPVVAIVETPDLAAPDDCNFVLAIDGVRDPGNLGTIIRSAAAAGVDAVVLLPGTTDPTNPKAVRATAGALYAIPVQQVRSIEDAVETFFSERPIVAIADAAAELIYDAVDWRRPTVLVIGGEAFGAADSTRTYADIAVRIPIEAGVESLNAAVAASILLFEVARSRRLAN